MFSILHGGDHPLFELGYEADSGFIEEVYIFIKGITEITRLSFMKITTLENLHNTWSQSQQY